MGEVIAICALVTVVIAQAIERYIFAGHMTAELSKCMKAVMAKNMNEYIAATTAEKPVVEQKETDEVYLSEATDEDFGKFIKQQTQ